jgi:hypothetical protein
MPQLIIMCSNFISISSIIIALLEGVTIYIDKVLIVGGGAKRNRSRRILTSILYIVIEYLYASSSLY